MSNKFPRRYSAVQFVCEVCVGLAYTRARGAVPLSIHAGSSVFRIVVRCEVDGTFVFGFLYNRNFALRPLPCVNRLTCTAPQEGFP